MFDWRASAQELLPDFYEDFWEAHESYSDGNSNEDLGQFLIHIRFGAERKPVLAEKVLVFAWSLWREGSTDEATMAATHVLEHLFETPSMVSAAARHLTEAQLQELSHFFIYQHGQDGFQQKLAMFRAEKKLIQKSSQKR